MQGTRSGNKLRVLWDNVVKLFDIHSTKREEKEFFDVDFYRTQESTGFTPLATTGMVVSVKRRKEKTL